MYDQLENLTIEEIRSIIQGLRLSGLSFVDPQAIDLIKEEIKHLPTAEDLSDCFENEVSLKNVIIQIGNILELIEKYNTKDVGYKSRYQLRTKLPPKNKVLEWRNVMKKSNNLIEKIVIASEKLDKKGMFSESEKALKIASKLNTDEIKTEDFNETIILAKELYEKNLYRQADDIMQEAALSDWWAGVKGGFSGAKQGFGQMAKQITDPAKMVKSVNRFEQYLVNSVNQTDSMHESMEKMKLMVANEQMKSVITEAQKKLVVLNKYLHDMYSNDIKKIRSGMQEALSPQQSQEQQVEQEQMGQQDESSNFSLDNLSNVPDEQLEKALEEYRAITQKLSNEKGNRTKARNRELGQQPQQTEQSQQAQPQMA
jgi:hypothetical protein